MLFADIDLLDENLDFRSHCWVGVRDGRVAYVGDAAPAGEEAARYGEVYDGRGCSCVLRSTTPTRTRP